jgi:hypothetical protein
MTMKVLQNKLQKLFRQFLHNASTALSALLMMRNVPGAASHSTKNVVLKTKKEMIS